MCIGDSEMPDKTNILDLDEDPIQKEFRNKYLSLSKNLLKLPTPDLNSILMTSSKKDRIKALLSDMDKLNRPCSCYEYTDFCQCGYLTIEHFTVLLEILIDE